MFHVSLRMATEPPPATKIRRQLIVLGKHGAKFKVRIGALTKIVDRETVLCLTANIGLKPASVNTPLANAPHSNTERNDDEQP